MIGLTTLLMSTFSPAQVAPGDVTWPQIQPAAVKVGFDLRSDAFELKFPIFDSEGDAAYWIMCVGGSDAYTDRLSGKTGFNFVPPLGCRLDTKSGWNDGSLLAPQGQSVWHTRGQFYIPEIERTCADYPEYGRLRNFKLRGMHLTFSIEEVEVGTDGKIDYFVLNINVEPDASAVSPISEKPGVASPYKESGLDCKRTSRTPNEL
jgi:hypothetical protein